MTGKSTRRNDEVLDREIVDLMMALFDSFKERFAAALEEFDLPMSQGHLLMSLEEPRAMSDLARHMGFDASHITSIVDRLEERDLVERRPDAKDRRVKRIAVTPAGDALRQQIRDRLFETLPPLSRLTKAQRTQLRDLLAIATAPDAT